MTKGSKYGKALLEAQWQNAEVNALYRLANAGVRVPTPLHYSENVLLMEMITDGNGNPAPRLWDVRLTNDEAVEVHQYLGPTNGAHPLCWNGAEICPSTTY